MIIEFMNEYHKHIAAGLGILVIGLIIGVILYLLSIINDIEED